MHLGLPVGRAVDILAKTGHSSQRWISFVMICVVKERRKVLSLHSMANPPEQDNLKYLTGILNFL